MTITAAAVSSAGSNECSHERDTIITVGRLVEVASRTWPGINKPGGVARVVAVHFDKDDGESDDEDEDNDNDSHNNNSNRVPPTTPTLRLKPTHVDVQYVVGSSKEKRVPIEYAKLAPQYETHYPSTTTTTSGSSPTRKARISLRDRSMLLGRCRRCGSLRTDCGSCDWASEEQQEAARPLQNTAGMPMTTTTTISRRNGSRPRNNKRTGQERIMEDPFGRINNDDSDDDEDMEQIQRLIRETKERRRNFSRKKRKWKKIAERTTNNGMQENETSFPSLSTSKRSQTRHPHAASNAQNNANDADQYDEDNDEKEDDNDNNDDDFDSDEWKDIEHSQRYNKYSHTKSKWRYRYPGLTSSSSDETTDDSARKNGKQGKRHKRVSGRSVLESLAGTTQTKKTSSIEAYELPSRKILFTRNDSNEKMQDSDEFCFPGDDEDPLSPDLPRRPKSQKPFCRDEIVSSSTPEHVQITSYLPAPASEIDSQLHGLEAWAVSEITNQERQGGYDGMIDDDFIQPEGEEAIENLPKDTVDKTKALPYKGLGPFFDTMAKKLEDETVPDFQLKVAALRRQWRSLHNDPCTQNVVSRSNDDTMRSTIDNSISAIELLNKCNEIFTELHVSLIRNGVDQCRMALRRLMDDKLYRKEKRYLSPLERKQCRGLGILDVRNLRMDSLEAIVEELVRDLKAVAELCEGQCRDEEEIGTKDKLDSDISTAEESSDDDRILDRGPATTLANDALLPSERSLGPFKSHQYAMAARKDQPASQEEQNQSGSGFHLHGRRKGSKLATEEGADDLSTSNSRSDHSLASAHRLVMGGYRSKASKNQKSIATIRPPGVKRAKMSVLSERAAEHDSDSDIQGSSFPKVVEETEAAENSSGKPGMNLSACPARQKLVSKRSSRDSVNESVFQSHKDRVQSISERMEAFLRANRDNGIRKYCVDYDDEDEMGRREETRATQKYRRRRTINSVPESYANSCHAMSQYTAREEPSLGGKLLRNRVQDSSRELQKHRGDDSFEALSAQSLFSHLAVESKMRDELTLDVDEVIDISKLQGDLEANFPSSLNECRGLVSRVEVALPNNMDIAPLFLHKAHQLLLSRDNTVLQELVAYNQSELSLYARFLALCVRSLKIVSSETDLPVVFRESKKAQFLDFLVHQLVDTLYSIFMPWAWGVEIDNRHNIIGYLAPLRNALGETMHLMESVSRCLAKSFGPQLWRRISSRNKVFISSADPNAWKVFIQTGASPEDPKETRLQQLDHHIWPRVEIDALWSVLAFTNGFRSEVEEKSSFRWSIISKLFSNGVLVVDNEETNAKLPPCEGQLLACQQEIGYFVVLFSTGNLKTLPQSDSILVNLIQRSLKLQAESYAGDENARALCYPSVSTRCHKSEKKECLLFWQMTDPKRLTSAPVDCRRSSVFDLPLDPSEDYVCYKHYKNILRPSSKILMNCLALLASWINSASHKKARQLRLMKSLNAMQDAIVSEARKCLPRNNSDMEFEDAFAVKPPEEIGIGSERAALFLREASAYLHIICSASTPTSAQYDMLTKVWNIIADDDTKKRQRHILDSGNERGSYNRDSYQLLLAAKVMATAVFVKTNISPWQPSLGKNITLLNATTSPPDVESFNFGVSCLFACLDCLCDVEGGEGVFMQIYKIIVVLFQSVTATIRVGVISWDMDKLRSIYFRWFSPVLAKCLKLHLSYSEISNSFLLRLCLSVTRAIKSFLAAKPHVTDHPHGPSKEGSLFQEDHGVWGGVDDEVFANLDFGALGPLSTAQNEQASPELLLWEYLSCALESSKPSARFAIVPTRFAPSECLQISSEGKHLVSNEMDYICDCLAMALAMESESKVSSSLSKLVANWIRPSCEENEDAEFSNKVAKRLALELCLLAEIFPSCQKFISNHADEMFYTFLASLLDSSRLETYPSCNLDKIREKAGKQGLEQACNMLELLNDDSLLGSSNDQQFIRLRRVQRRHREKAAETWDFAKKLGSAICDVDSDNPSLSPFKTIGKALLNQDSTQQLDALETNFSSLENETFNIFQVIRKSISAASTGQKNNVTFEKTASFCLLVLANQILRIVQSLKYHDQCSNATSKRTDREFKRAGLSELLTCFVELFVASMAWILRESRYGNSEAWSFFQRQMRDKFLSPILRRQPIDVTNALQEMILSAKSCITCTRRLVASTIMPPSLVGCAKYLDGYLFTSAVRRSRQLLIASALNEQTVGLQNALLEAVIGSNEHEEDMISMTVGASFPLSRRRDFPVCLGWPYESPIQKYIDDYLMVVEEENVPSNNISWWNAVAEMRLSFIMIYIVPRLNHRLLHLAKKRRIIKLLSQLLACDVTPMPCSNEIGEYKVPVDVTVVCAIIKSITFSVCQCLEQNSVDDSFASSLFMCSIYLAKSTVIIDGMRWKVIDWSQSTIQETKAKNFLELSKSEIDSTYAWVFFRWLESIATMLTSTNDGIEQDLLLLRSHWREMRGCRRGGMHDESLNLDDRNKSLEQWDRLLSDFEDFLFPSKSEITPDVKNIYSKVSTKDWQSLASKHEESLMAWTPASPVQKSAKLFMATVLSMS